MDLFSRIDKGELAGPYRSLLGFADHAFLSYGLEDN
jgi:hypothetical protein